MLDKIYIREGVQNEAGNNKLVMITQEKKQKNKLKTKQQLTHLNQHLKLIMIHQIYVYSLFFFL